MLTEAVVGRPDPRLRRWVDSYLGYREDAPVPLVRREVAGAFVVLILGWGDPLGVTDPRAPGESGSATNAFLAGPFDGWCATRTAGTGTGVQVLLTAPAARRLLGCRWPRWPTGWCRSTRWRAGWPGCATSWPASRAGRHASPGSTPPWPRGWRRQRRRTRTCWRPGGVWTAAGSGRRGHARRRAGLVPASPVGPVPAEFGLPPKTVARLLRFERAYASLGRTLLTADAAVPDDAGWAQRAARWGYYDQSHLIREFREFAGATPAALTGPGSHSSNPA
ncbi:helix-turn-helix domain-containing protein [Micromonospora sp. BRA006-A]|nr:helix-turn-helix domain-containing protein [Micromonospora sp. BRA006-A]